MTTDPDNRAAQAEGMAAVRRQERKDAQVRADAQRLRDEMDPPDDCPGCGAPRGYPPAGPCDNHGTAAAHAR